MPDLMHTAVVMVMLMVFFIMSMLVLMNMYMSIVFMIVDMNMKMTVNVLVNMFMEMIMGVFMRMFVHMLVRVLMKIFSLFHVTYKHCHIRAMDPAFFGIFPAESHVRNSDPVQFFNKRIRFRHQFQQSGCQHISGSTHSTVNI